MRESDFEEKNLEDSGGKFLAFSGSTGQDGFEEIKPKDLVDYVELVTVGYVLLQKFQAYGSTELDAILDLSIRIQLEKIYQQSGHAGVYAIELLAIESVVRALYDASTREDQPMTRGAFIVPGHDLKDFLKNLALQYNHGENFLDFATEGIAKGTLAGLLSEAQVYYRTSSHQTNISKEKIGINLPIADLMPKQEDNYLKHLLLQDLEIPGQPATFIKAEPFGMSGADTMGHCVEYVFSIFNPPDTSETRREKDNLLKKSEIDIWARIKSDLPLDDHETKKISLYEIWTKLENSKNLELQKDYLEWYRQEYPNDHENAHRFRIGNEVILSWEQIEKSANDYLKKHAIDSESAVELTNPVFKTPDSVSDILKKKINSVIQDDLKDGTTFLGNCAELVRSIQNHMGETTSEEKLIKNLMADIMPLIQYIQDQDKALTEYNRAWFMSHLTQSSDYWADPKTIILLGLIQDRFKLLRQLSSDPNQLNGVLFSEGWVQNLQTIKKNLQVKCLNGFVLANLEREQEYSACGVGSRDLSDPIPVAVLKETEDLFQPKLTFKN